MSFETWLLMAGLMNKIITDSWLISHTQTWTYETSCTKHASQSYAARLGDKIEAKYLDKLHLQVQVYFHSLKLMQRIFTILIGFSAQR